jgi:hypothetical protein
MIGCRAAQALLGKPSSWPKHGEAEVAVTAIHATVVLEHGAVLGGYPDFSDLDEGFHGVALMMAQVAMAAS